MSYSLEFKGSAPKEWRKLAGGVREQLKKKLAERLERREERAVRIEGDPPPCSLRSLPPYFIGGIPPLARLNCFPPAK